METGGDSGDFPPVNDLDANGAPPWQRARRSGIRAIAIGSLVAAGIWLAIRFLVPPLEGMYDGGARLVFAFKWICLAALFTLVMGIEAVAHERLQSPAFDPLEGHLTRRLEVNQRYLQNTLEQFVVFAVGLLGLAWYCNGGEEMRAVTATAVVWIAARFAFWLGYHRSAAMRGLGAPGVIVSLLVLLYVSARVGFDFAGWPGVAVVLAAFFAIEAVLFSSTAKR